MGTTAPRPQTVGDHRTTARMVSMAWLEMLGHDQPRDSHVRGGPHARSEPTAPLGPHPRGVCARRTATKYRNTTTATRHPERLGAALACSTVNMVAVARSSGRRGRRFKSCHPDCIPAGQRPLPELVRASLLPVQQQNTASTATKTRIDLRIEGAPPSLRFASRVAIGLAFE